MPHAERLAPRVGTEWLASALLLVAIIAGTSSLSALLVGTEWHVVAGALAALMLASAAVVRSIARVRAWATLAAIVAAVFALTAYFASGSALFGFIPTAATVDTVTALQRAGLSSIAAQFIPAVADEGILLIVCMGVVAITLAADALVFVARAPAVAALPLFVLVIVPTFVIPDHVDLVSFAVVTISWLAVLLVSARRVPSVATAGMVAIAVTVAIGAPLLLPAVTPGGIAAGGVGGFAASVNPIVTLGNDLRRPDAQLALSYTTTAPGGTYLRLAVLDDLSGQSWLPTPSNGNSGTDLENIGPVPGVAPGIPVTTRTTDVRVASVSSQWLPVPYAPTKVTGLTGAWTWDRVSLAVSSSRSGLSNQNYQVTSADVSPSVQQLESAGTQTDPQLQRDLVVPPNLPAVVAETARTVAGAATTNYDKAIALQAYFTGGLFTYSEKAPVDQGYDGSGASVLEAFLKAKSGYCVHFASAMTAMARTLGIPARVAVGFTPGQAVAGSSAGSQQYTVTTHDLHAWPELYFTGIGWVRFEPTPGRGFAPAFAPLVADNPATPNVNESIPVPSSSRSAVPVPGATPSLPVDAAPATGSAVGASGGAAASGLVLQGALVVVVLFLLSSPALVRMSRRASRLRAVAAGSAARAWEEIVDTATDLRLGAGESFTPRQTAEALSIGLDSAGRAALDRVLTSVERESFASVAGDPAVADVVQVSHSLRESAGIARRILALAFPLSLVESRGAARKLS